MKIISDKHTNEKLQNHGVSIPEEVTSKEEANDLVAKINETNMAVASFKENAVQIKQLLID